MEVAFGEGGNEETVSERGDDDGHAAGEEGDPGERADMEACPAECVNGEGKYHRENNHDERGVNEAVGRAYLGNCFQGLDAGTGRCNRMMRDGKEHQEGAGSEDETGEASFYLGG